MSLARLLCDGRPPRALVAYGRSGSRDFADFRARVAGLAARIEQEGRGRWLVHCDDAYAFAVALFAIAHAGALAVLLPNRQPGTLARAAPLAQGALLGGDEGDAREANGRLPCVLDPLADAWLAVSPAELRPLDLRAPLLELSTSGTTGEGKQIGKALRHLDAEVAVLEASFGGALGPTTQVFATASAQHLYGLLFRVLWPLAAGRPFHGPTYLHAEELLPRIEDAGDALLASTPAHLSRMSGLSRVRGACREVFSSGGALDAETATAVREALGRAPVEVFGSTETGGVAWRRQDGTTSGERWTPLPGVRVAREAEGDDAGRLRVVSPFVSAEGGGGEGAGSFLMGDLAELGDDGRFLVLGRADRTVKIGEKRLALPEMESQLRVHPFVEEAALLTLEQGGDARVGAVLVLSEAGRRALAEGGRRALSARLAEDLAAHWDRVLLPRVWRSVDALPRDAQGKTPVALLRELFSGSRAPILHAETRGPRSLARDVSVPDDLVYLQGHFEGFPVVPGVVQVGWVVDAAQGALGVAPRVAAVENLKFKELLLPGQRFLLEVDWDERRDVLRFRLAAGERVFSTGRLRLRGDTAA